MKRWLTGIAAALLLAGCAPAAAAPPKPPQQFAAAGRLRYQGMEAQVSLRREGYDVLAFDSPAGLRGLRLTLDPSFAVMEYGELERRFTRGSLPENSVAELIFSALDAAGESGVGEDGACRGPGGTFTLKLEAGSGNILKLSIPDQDLELEIQSFEKLGQTA